MRQLLPALLGDVDPYDLYRPTSVGGPLLRVNMVASADGRATGASGRSGPLASPGDRAVFRALRALADAILVGAETVRVEGYGPHRLTAALAQRRMADGRSRPAPIVIVSRSLDLDPASRLFAEAVTPTVVLTCASAPVDRSVALQRVGRVMIVGDDAVDLPEALRRLRSDLGLAHVLCEGGPTLNGYLFGGRMVDELCLTVAPTLAGGKGPGIVRWLTGQQRLKLVTLCEEDDALFARYRIAG